MSKEKTLAEFKCVSSDIKELILKRFKHDRRFNPNMDALCSSIESAPACGSESGEIKKVKKGSRKKNTRDVFMGLCMRGQQKGGMGKDMASCSGSFKNMSSEEKKKYMPKE